MSVKRNFMATTAMSIAVAAIMGAGCAPSLAQDANALANAGKNGKDWLSYHGSYQSWHYSPLSQIDASNVKKLKIAFIHQVGKSTRGVQSTPLAKDGVIYAAQAAGLPIVPVAFAAQKKNFFGRGTRWSSPCRSRVRSSSTARRSTLPVATMWRTRGNASSAP